MFAWLFIGCINLISNQPYMMALAWLLKKALKFHRHLKAYLKSIEVCVTYHNWNQSTIWVSQLPTRACVMSSSWNWRTWCTPPGKVGIGNHKLSRSLCNIPLFTEIAFVKTDLSNLWKNLLCAPPEDVMLLEPANVVYTSWKQGLGRGLPYMSRLYGVHLVKELYSESNLWKSCNQNPIYDRVVIRV
jgi:hypothetical protein